MLPDFLLTHGFTMDTFWKFDNTSIESLRNAIQAGGISTVWETSTAGKAEYGFLRSEVTNRGEAEAVVNPKDLEVKLVDTMVLGRCLLFNYTKAVKKGTSVSLYFEPSLVRLVEFATYFLDDYDMPAAVLDSAFGRYVACACA